MIKKQLIVGLGNPGRTYKDTRHNIGFHVNDRLVKTIKAKPLENTSAYEIYTGHYDDYQLYFLYPLTYMNRSGYAVFDVAQQFDIHTDNIIIIYDDFNLPLGSIRIRPGGSAGGHNGLTSVLEMLQTNDIPRIRLGIYNEKSASRFPDPADFVLSAFETNEKETVETMIQDAHDAVLTILKEGIPKAMNRFNKVADTSKNSITNKNMEL